MLAAHVSASTTASDGESSPALDVGDGSHFDLIHREGFSVSRGLQTGLSQHFLGLFQREFRVIPHDNRQQLGSHLREAERLRRPEFMVFAVGPHGQEARTTRRRMPSDGAKLG